MKSMKKIVLLDEEAKIHYNEDDIISHNKYNQTACGSADFHVTCPTE